VELQQYSYTPLVEIQALSEFGGGIPLFESIVGFENYPLDSSLREQRGSLQFSQRKMFTQTNYPLTLVAVPREDLLLKINYHTSLFALDTIERMLGHLETILSAMLKNPGVYVGEIPLLTEEERQQLLVEWNSTESEYPTDKCIHQLFEEKAEQTPNAVAVVFKDQELTYQQLNQRANQLAHHLQSLGVGPEVLVGICVKRSLEMVVGLLGILKAGGAYVPLDPSVPPSRLNYMLADSGVEVLLVQQSLCESLPPNTARVFCLDSEWGAIEQLSRENLDVAVWSDNLAYAIYTSGSTGVPKGVLVAHQGLLNLVFWHQATFAITSSDIATQLAGTAFDASAWELWPYLSAGARVHLLPEEIIVQPQVLQDWFISKQITITFVPTPLLESLLSLEWPSSSTLRIVLTGGDKLHQYPSTALPFRVINNYGPTENTVVTTSGLLVSSKETNLLPPIGRPIFNTQIYILDTHLQAVPVGVPGEIYIGGDGLARGYLNRPELTAEKFIPNPFNKSKLYKTGDLARYLSDGNIEFLGRIDNQVKVRGFRIELGEIEAVLNTHPQIQQAVVISTEDTPENNRLVAYLVIEDESLSTHQLRKYLKQRLPEYMVPAAFVTLDTLPLTPNGKVDRRALPALEGELIREHEYVAPRTPSEEILANLFATVLKLDNVGIHDNFFELGGHSLLALRLISKMSKAIGAVIPVNLLFLQPTVAELATVIDKSLLPPTPAQNAFFPPDQSALVKIQAGSPGRIPLFFVHAAGGGVLSYTDLARHLGEQQPFYGLQIPVGKCDYARYTTIETMASHYIEEILKVHTDGPYLLGGWSMGGVVAFEMAQQLKAMANKVPLLALLDSRVPINDREPGQEIDLIKTFAMHLSSLEEKDNMDFEALKQLASDDQLTYLLNLLKQDKIVSCRLELSDFHHLFEIFKSNLKAIQSYVPRFYPDPIRLFKCLERQGSPLSSDLGWNAFAGENLTVHEVPGNHFTMIKPPHVVLLADQLKKYLNEFKMNQTRNIRRA
jgi:amino acid adenylation domain-containing protein